MSSRSTAAPPWPTPRASSASPGGSWRPSKAGNDVCVVVSAMGDTTDELLDLAEQVSPLPPAREMDMLLTAGERISMALVAMAIANLGHTARSFTGSQAGVITDSSHGRARIIDVTPGRITDGARGGPHRHRRRLPGREPGQQGDHHAGPRRLRHDRRRARRRPQGRRVRDLHRRRRRLHRRPAHRAERAQGRPHLHRGDARAGRLRRQDPAAPLRRVRPPLRHAHPRALLVLLPRGHLGRPEPLRRRRHGSADHRRGRPRPQRGQDHRRRRSGPARQGRRDLPGRLRRRDQHRHDRPERLRHRDRPDRHLLHAAQDRWPGRRRRR